MTVVQPGQRLSADPSETLPGRAGGAGVVQPGQRLSADPSLQRHDAGRVLVGGSPLRVMKISDRGARHLEDWLGGAVVAEDGSERRLAGRLVDAALLHPLADHDQGPGLAEVTLVVPVRDDPRGLAELLGRLAGEPAVIVVDDGSAEGGAVAATATRRQARLVARATSGGPAVARNTGLGLVTTPFVCFVDADVTIQPDCIRLLLGHFRDPAVVAVAPRVRSRPGHDLLSSYESLYSPLDLGPVASPVGPGRRVGYVPSAALVARTGTLLECGGFDPALRWGEDVDLVWRLVAAGHTVRYEPAAQAWHRPRGDWAGWVRQRRNYGASAAALAARHGFAAAPARCSPWSAAAIAAALTGRPLTGAVLAAGLWAELAIRLRRIPGCRVLALRLALRGHVAAGASLAVAGSRAWWPLALILAALRRRLRAVLLAALVLPALIEWWKGRRPAGVVVSLVLRLADHMAYGIGVWEGLIARRSLSALCPDLRRNPTALDPSRDEPLGDEPLRDEPACR